MTGRKTSFGRVLLILSGLIGHFGALAQESRCFQAVADSYVRQSSASTNFGGAAILRLLSLDANADQSLVFLRFDLSPIPNDALVTSASLQLYLEAGTVSANYPLHRATAPWQEFNLTWNNKPGNSGLFDNPVHTAASGRKSWNATQPVSDWVTGAFANYGFVVSTPLLDAPTDFSSRQGSTYSERPRLCVDWTAGGTTDLIATGLEVTQAVQDLNNSVPLIAGKRTFVRLYAQATDREYLTYAQLSVNCDGFGRIIYPINNGNGYSVVKLAPDRGVLDHAFLFELPSECVDEAESIQLQGFVNPVTTWRGEYPPESSSINNLTSQQTFSFESVPALDLLVYRGKYRVGATFYETALGEIFQLRSWLLRAFPLSEVSMAVRGHWMGDADVSGGDITSPDSGKVNSRIRALRKIDINKYDASKETIHYVMVDDGGGFMRGSARKPVGSGPTGDPSGEGWGWDTDGSYGDWYGAHEIAHALKRKHVKCSGSEKRADGKYPHSGGLISSATTGAAALLGFDSRPTPTVYGPTSSDVLSYCEDQWISDYTHNELKDYIQDEFSTKAAPAEPAGGSAADRFLVAGTISGNQADLLPVFLVPDVPEPDPSAGGDHDIVLLAANGSELARHPFAPALDESGPPPGDDPTHPPAASFVFDEWVTHVPGTARIAVEGPSGLLALVNPGATPPTITVDAPNGGEVISGDSVLVQWTASDSDGDPLGFNIEFSPDNGLTWTALEYGVEGNQLEISRDSLESTAGSNGLFRVWASDGIHSSSDTSDAGFTVSSNAPLLEILSPMDGDTFAVDQTINLQVEAYSDLVGAMYGDQIRWVSSQDAFLGTGEQLALNGLSEGVHALVVTANDQTRSSIEVVQITVVADPSLLPQGPRALAVGPRVLNFRPDLGIDQASISVGNGSGTNPLNWQAFESASWLSVSKTSGTTPETLTATVDATTLAPGQYSANIVFLSADIPGGGSRVVRASFTIYPPDELFSNGFE